MHEVLALLGLLGALLAFVCTWRYGLGTSPDSASYLAAAKSLLSGAGYRYFDGRVYTQWPPLFPTLLALPGLVGIEPLTAARFLNGMSFGLIVFLSGELFLRCTRSRAFALLGTLSVGLSTWLFEAALMVWSEPVFVVLTLLFTLTLPRLLRAPSLSSLLAVGGLAGLACLQRYAGVSLILAGSVLILLGMSGASLRRRAGYLVAFCLLAAGPLAGWLARNHFVGGQTVGGHRLHRVLGPEVYRALNSALDLMATWVFPRSFAHSLRLVGAGLVLGLTLLLVLSLGRRVGERKSPRATQIGGVVVCGLVYFGFLVVTSAALSWAPEQRLLVPLYVLVVVPVWAGMEEAGRMARERWGGGNLAGIVAVVVCALGLVQPFRVMTARICGYADHGLGDYGTVLWRQSALMDWLRRHPLEGAVYSNVPDAVFILTGQAAQTTPTWYEDTAKFAATMPASPARYLVWFHPFCRNGLYDLPELASRWRMEEVASCPDGKVYRFLGNRGPGVTAVYRFWSPQEGRHSYTADKQERDHLVLIHSREWACEGPVFYVFAEQQPGTTGVHCFESPRPGIRFYTISAREKEKLLRDPTGVWTYRGVLFYVYPQRQNENLRPVYRLWSTRLGYHFYCADPAEKEKVVNDGGWIDEGVVWYAYGP